MNLRISHYHARFEIFTLKGGAGDFSPKHVNSKITAINIVLSTNERLAIKPARVQKCTRKINYLKGYPGEFSIQALWKFVLEKKALFRDPCTAMRQNGELEASAPTDPGLHFCSSATSFCQAAGVDEIFCLTAASSAWIPR
jgi:hypothetical protein